MHAGLEGDTGPCAVTRLRAPVRAHRSAIDKEAEAEEVPVVTDDRGAHGDKVFTSRAVIQIRRNFIMVVIDRRRGFSVDVKLPADPAVWTFTG